MINKVVCYIYKLSVINIVDRTYVDISYNSIYTVN